jgi:hypothetical protein
MPLRSLNIDAATGHDDVNMRMIIEAARMGKE